MIHKLYARYPSILAPLYYLGLALTFYTPLLLGLRTFPDGDFTHHFLPFSLFQQAALRAGTLPLWNPYTYSGHPFLADTQAAVFYPLSNLVLWLTWPWTTVGARLYFLQLEAILQIALAGYFVDLLVRELTQTRWAALLSGCAFAFSGYLTGYPPLQLAVLRTAIWLPLILWLLTRAFAQPTRWRWWIGAALAFATAFLAGHPQTFLYISYTIVAYCMLRIALLLTRHTPRATGHALHATIGFLVFLLLTLALSAAQLLPSLEFARLSVRANVDYDFVSGGFPLQDSWQLLLPGVLTQFSPLYIGVIGLGLVFLGTGYWVLNLRRPVDHSSLLTPHFSLLGFFLALTVVALLLSYGRNAFLYPLFYRFAPGWNLFRGQERAAFLVSLGLSVLAGYGAAAIPTMSIVLRRRLALLFILLVAASVYGYGLFWQLLGHSAISQSQYLLLALITLSLAAGLVVALRIPGWGPLRTIALPLLLIANLFWANFTTNLDQFGPIRKTILAPEMEAVGQALASEPIDAATLPGRVYNEARVYEDYGMRQQIEDAWGSSPLRLARYAALFENFPLDRMWRLTGVRYLLTWRKELFEPGQSELLATFPQVKDTTYLHRLTAPNPRAWVVSQIRIAEDQEASKQLAEHSFDIEHLALIPPITHSADTTTKGGDNHLQLNRVSNQQLHIEIQSENGGLLVISENWMPGWRVQNIACNCDCSIDTPCNYIYESPFPNLSLFVATRVNLTFIGIPIPPGSTKFDLLYWPTSVSSGLLISSTTLLLLFLIYLWRWRRLQSQALIKKELHP